MAYNTAAKDSQRSSEMNAHRIEATLTADGTLTLSNLPFHAGDAVEIIVLERSVKSVAGREKEKTDQKLRALKRSQSKTTPFVLKGSLELHCSLEELEEEMKHIRSTWTEAAWQSSNELTRDLTRK